MRNCEGCTKCCEGTLSGTVKEITFYKGKPCHLCITNKGCADYANRPEQQCVNFKCEWLKNINLPEWFKPSTSNLIRTSESINTISYIRVLETDGIIGAEYLSWLVSWAIKDSINLLWQCKGGYNYIGSSEFVTIMNLEFPK
jgi:hypothetical protein